MTQLEALIHLVYEPAEVEALLRLLEASPLTEPEQAELIAHLSTVGVRSLTAQSLRFAM